MKRLIIVRHGNTFRPGETPLRVGCRTDLPLVEEERALGAGRILKEKGLFPDRVYAAPLKRTRQTAELILRALERSLPVETLDIFTEIDYGEDEAKTEDEVMDRLGRVYLEREGKSSGASEEVIRERGRRVVEDWNTRAEPPDGWKVDPDAIVRSWKGFAEEIGEGETVLVVSSNGVIRFAPHLLAPQDYERFVSEHNLKVTTGGTSIFEYTDCWTVRDWNIKPREKGFRLQASGFRESLENQNL